MSRAYTKDEVVNELMQYMRDMAKYWAELPNLTTLDRCMGMAHSMLCVFDGVTPSLPAIDLVLSPHPEDKQYCIDGGINWYPARMAINADCHLHDLLYQIDRVER